MAFSRFIPVLLLAGASALAPNDDDGAEFTACMRSHGLADFPEATVDDDGRVHLGEGAAVDPFSSTYRTALDACRDTLPEGTALPGIPPNPAAPPTLDGTSCAPVAPATPVAPAGPAEPGV